jgi:Heparinase II/III-like protein/Heparinase II/III N-terminus
MAGVIMNKWRRLYNDVRALPITQAAPFLLSKAGKGRRQRQNQRNAYRQIREIETNLASVLEIDGDLPSYLDAKFTNLEGFPIQPDRRQKVAELLNGHFPEWADRCLKSARALCDHRISVLGHALDLGGTIDWHKDYVSGARWSADPAAPSRILSHPQGADIKFVWELSRFHHGVTLGRAFALTGDERFASKFVDLLTDWTKKNTPGAGPNWRCAMEAAIRAVNLLWAGSLVASSQAFDAKAREGFVKGLLAHGIFIYHNLEFSERVVGNSVKPVNGNHYLSDLAGLLYISCAFPECRWAEAWRELARRELVREIRAQVDEEGVHCEYSPNYHRLVLEIIMGCLILMDQCSLDVPADVREKVSRMFDFILHYRKPSGDVPLIRDIDNGRFCILGDDELTNHDHLLALGAVYFDRPVLHPGRLFEDGLWQLGPRACEWESRVSMPSAARPSAESAEKPSSSPVCPVDTKERLSVPSKFYRQSGFAVMRQDGYYLLAVCCPKGMQGYCGHTHNDFLSFELEAYGQTFLTDCGSYVYGQSPEWRNRFRSVRSHNTLVVDGQEPNAFDPVQLFEIDSKARPAIMAWESTPDRDTLAASYKLFLPDGTEATHERRFTFLKDRGQWLIEDHVNGHGTHTIETRFHFGEGVDVATAGERKFHAMSPSGSRLDLSVPGDNPFSTHLESGWISRVYGIKQPIRVLRLVCSVALPFRQAYLLAPSRCSMANQESPGKDLTTHRPLTPANDR